MFCDGGLIWTAGGVGSPGTTTGDVGATMMTGGVTVTMMASVVAGVTVVTTATDSVVRSA
jgi:hypothetical protein